MKGRYLLATSPRWGSACRCRFGSGGRRLNDLVSDGQDLDYVVSVSIRAVMPEEKKAEKKRKKKKKKFDSTNPFML